MKQNVAATAAKRVPRSNLPTWRNRNRKPTRQPTTARSFSSDGLQWPPVEVPRRLRTRVVDSNLARCRSLKSHVVLGVNVATGPRGSTGLRLRRPVPFALSRVLTSHLLGVVQALGTYTAAADTPVGTPLGTQITKIQSSDCSAFVAVDSTPTVIPVSKFLNVTGATTQLLQQQNVKLHPVLGMFVPTRRRVPELLSLFPGGNCEN